jgi:large subunit ribosomal protein L11
MQVKLLVEGGSMKPGPALSQKLGPMGINLNQLIEKVNEATKSFEGLKVPVELDINTSTKKFDVKVFSPPVSELMKKELKIDKGSGIQKKMQVANASIEQVISVAKMKYQNLLARSFKAAVKSVVGTCVSLGVLVENKPAAEVEKEIDEGKYDKEIESESTQTPADKKLQMDAYFSELKAKQEKALKQEQAAAEAAKEAAAATAGTATTATVKEGEKKEEKAETKEAKK